MPCCFLSTIISATCNLFTVRLCITKSFNEFHQSFSELNIKSLNAANLKNWCISIPRRKTEFFHLLFSSPGWCVISFPVRWLWLYPSLLSLRCLKSDLRKLVTLSLNALRFCWPYSAQSPLWLLLFLLLPWEWTKLGLRRVTSIRALTGFFTIFWICSPIIIRARKFASIRSKIWLSTPQRTDFLATVKEFWKEPQWTRQSKAPLLLFWVHLLDSESIFSSALRVYTGYSVSVRLCFTAVRLCK